MQQYRTITNLLHWSFHPECSQFKFHLSLLIIYGFLKFSHKNAWTVPWNITPLNPFRSLPIHNLWPSSSDSTPSRKSEEIMAPLLTLSSSKLNSPYSRRVPFPLVKIPQPDIIVVPLRMFVMVAGNSSAVGLCVVMPTSMLPDHLSTRRSIRIWKTYNDLRFSQCYVLCFAAGSSKTLVPIYLTTWHMSEYLDHHSLADLKSTSHWDKGYHAGTRAHWTEVYSCNVGGEILT